MHQHWNNLDRSVDLNAPSEFDRTAPGQTRTVAAANATRPILPVNGGVRQVNVLMNLGEADYDGLQTQVSYRGNAKLFATVSYTLSKATNTTRAGRQRRRAERGEHRRGWAKKSADRAWSTSVIARSSRSRISCRTTSRRAR